MNGQGWAQQCLPTVKPELTADNDQGLMAITLMRPSSELAQIQSKQQAGETPIHLQQEQAGNGI